MCEDYRAGLAVDRAADEADRAAGRRIGCPTLFCWSTRDDMVELYGDPLAIWRPWADDVRGGSRSTAATTWPRTRPTSSPLRCGPCWRADRGYDAQKRSTAAGSSTSIEISAISPSRNRNPSHCRDSSSRWSRIAPIDDRRDRALAADVDVLHLGAEAVGVALGGDQHLADRRTAAA